MPDPRVCCALGACCEPPQQAAALAAYLRIEVPAAQAVAGMTPGEGYLLVPRMLHRQPVAPGDEERANAFAEAAQQRLAKLNRHVKAELRAILIDLGHKAEQG